MHTSIIGHKAGNMIKLTVNGQQQSWDGDPSLPLLWYLRDEAGLTGTKFGCGKALCGSCTVHVDGRAARACITFMSDVADRTITTIEGLDPNGDHPVQKAWRETNVPQCGFCQAGQIMQAAALLKENPRPSDADIRDTMSGNICRCGCYQRIEAAVRLAATGA
jgi:isoquinoline 1-oxidoreductase alpha subunit